jgi:hypothetical protein
MKTAINLINSERTAPPPPPFHVFLSLEENDEPSVLFGAGDSVRASCSLPLRAMLSAPTITLL